MKSKIINNILIVLAVAILSATLATVVYAACPSPPTASMGINSGSSTSLAGLLILTKNNGVPTRWSVSLSEGQTGGGIKLLNSSYKISKSYSSAAWWTGSTYYISNQSTACTKAGYIFLGYGSSKSYGNKFALDCKYSATVPYKYAVQVNKVTSTTGWWDYYLSSYGTETGRIRLYPDRPSDSRLSGGYNDNPSITFKVTNGRTTYLVFNYVKVPTYTLSYNANGGTGAPANQTVYSGSSTIVSSIAPTRTGYTFSGWNTNSSASGTDYFGGNSITLTSNKILYAEWGKSTPAHVSPSANQEFQPGSNNVVLSGKGTNNSTNSSLGVGIHIVYRKVGASSWSSFASSARTCASGGVSSSINVNGWKPDVSNGCYANSGSTITYPALSITEPGQYEWKVQSIVRPRTFVYSGYTSSRYFTVVSPPVACSISDYLPDTNQSIVEGTELSFSVDSSNETSSWIKDITDNATIVTTTSATSGNINGERTFNNLGTKTIQFACDGNDADSNPDDWQQITVTVTPSNRAPVVTLDEPDNEAKLDTSSVTLEATATDPDGDDLSDFKIFYQYDGQVDDDGKPEYYESLATNGASPLERMWETGERLEARTYWWYAEASDDGGATMAFSTIRRFEILPPTCDIDGSYTIDAGDSLNINYSTDHATNAKYAGADIPIGVSRTYSIANFDNSSIIINVSAYGRTGNCDASVTINTLSCSIIPTDDQYAPARVRIDVSGNIAGPFKIEVGKIDTRGSTTFPHPTTVYENVSNDSQYHMIGSEGIYGATVSSGNFKGGAPQWCNNAVIIFPETDDDGNEVTPGG